MSSPMPKQKHDPSDTGPPRLWSWTLWAPVLAWLAFLAWSNIPPYRMHVNKAKPGVLAWHWRLFEQGGRGIL